MYVLSTDLDLLGPWVCELSGGGLWSHVGRSVLGELDGDTGMPAWGVIYEAYYPPASIRMHVAVTDPKCVTRRALHMVFTYPFDQLGVKTVFGHVSSDNRKSLDFCKRLGFTEVARVPGVYPTGDLCIFTMTREACRWLKGKKHGQARISTAAA